jgi:hypothetical protein
LVKNENYYYSLPGGPTKTFTGAVQGGMYAWLAAPGVLRIFNLELNSYPSEKKAVTKL